MVLERPALFSENTASDYIKILESARAKEFARGEMLYIEGDPVDQIMLVISGFAKITQLGVSGAEVILRFGAPGDVLGPADLLSAGKHCSTAQAFRSCRALVWEERVFKALMERFPILNRKLLRIVFEELVELEARFREVATERVGPRVARQLARLAAKIGRPVDGTLELDLSREDLAQMTGTTLFTVSRLLSAWEARGIVIPRREAVTICDVASLRSVGE